MNYYIDTEFLEGPQKEKFPISLFRKETKPTIDLISIGIVSEDGREYYAISKDFNLEEAWNRFDLKLHSGDRRNIGDGTYKEYWIRENVLKPIWRELMFKADECWGMSNKQTAVYYKEILTGAYDHHFSFKSLKALIQKYGKPNKQIAEEIIEFTEPTNRYYSLEGEKRFTHGSVAVGNPLKEEDIKKNNLIYHYPASNPKFYAYYADYDWVAFCWLFGKMMDLPNGFPKYCNDLKQILDECALEERVDVLSLERYFPKNIEEGILKIKMHPNFPQQQIEHNALEDARWNKKLHKFLKSI